MLSPTDSPASAAGLAYRDRGFPTVGRVYTALCTPRTALPPQAAPYLSVSSVFIRTCRSDNRCPPDDHRQTQYKPAMSKPPHVSPSATGGAERRVTGGTPGTGEFRGGMSHSGGGPLVLHFIRRSLGGGGSAERDGGFCR